MAPTVLHVLPNVLQVRAYGGSRLLRELANLVLVLVGVALNPKRLKCDT